jgi:guanine deaminase
MGILTALREASVVSKVLSFNETSKLQADKDRGRSLTPKKKVDLPQIESESPDAAILASSEGFTGKHLPLETLFFLATLGGAEVCDMQDRIGNFVVGKEFDALLVRTGQNQEGHSFDNQLNPALFVEENDGLETLFEKFLFAGDDRNVSLHLPFPTFSLTLIHLYRSRAYLSEEESLEEQLP